MDNGPSRFSMPGASKPGAPPGTLTTTPGRITPSISVIEIGKDKVFERTTFYVKDLANLKMEVPVTWINIEGIGDEKFLTQLGQVFNIHPLALEDIASSRQRTKVEEYPDHLYLVIQVPVRGKTLTTQQLNIILGKNYVITIEEKKLGYLDPVKHRIQNSCPAVRFLQPDYLAYAIIDASIDAFYPFLEVYGELLESTEREITSNPKKDILSRIYTIKRDLQVLRRAVWPQRDAMNILMRENFPYIHDENRMFIRDCHDHAVQLMDLTETFREFGSDLVNLYMNRISNDMNAVMKVLTIIATIFMPLTFIAGVYGMNFNTDVSPWNMPELNWYYGYPFSIGLMLVSALILLGVFKYRKWF